MVNESSSGFSVETLERRVLIHRFCLSSSSFGEFFEVVHRDSPSGQEEGVLPARVISSTLI